MAPSKMGLSHDSAVINQLAKVQAMASQLQEPLDLPQIVVLGSQSSGKSSVLESLNSVPETFGFWGGGVQ